MGFAGGCQRSHWPTHRASCTPAVAVPWWKTRRRDGEVPPFNVQVCSRSHPHQCTGHYAAAVWDHTGTTRQTLSRCLSVFPSTVAQGEVEAVACPQSAAELSDLMEARDQPLLLKVGVRAPLT